MISQNVHSENTVNFSIQFEYSCSDEEITLQIKERPLSSILLYGYREYDDSMPPFDPSLMVYFRERLTPEALGEINEMIIARAQPQKAKEPKKDDKDDHDPGNGGTMIIDATYAPSNVKYPQDTSLLNEARESAKRSSMRSAYPEKESNRERLHFQQPLRLKLKKTAVLRI